MKKLISLLLGAACLLFLAFSFALAKRKNPKTPALQTQPAVGLNLGNQAPEIALKDPYGVTIKLSSLRGKLVLIDFWASWCGPCRHENPNVVQCYLTYKDKKFKNGNGFTVYSVSLDVDNSAWQKAIRNDGLAWASHVSELLGWNSAVAAQYNVTGIPTNFLINDKGIIVARDLRGEALGNALKKYLAQ